MDFACMCGNDAQSWAKSCYKIPYTHSPPMPTSTVRKAKTILADFHRPSFRHRQVNAFKIPPRPGGGHKSGTWLVEDKIFTGRLRVTSQGTACTIFLEDENGREFAQCPIPRGEKDQAVEPVTDSSRYFVIRLMTPGDARQKAFVGLGFDDRSDAFDFQVALTDHEKHLRRAQDTALAAQSSSTPSIQNSSRSEFSSDAANLYQSRDLSLKEGETMKINFKRPGDSQAGSGLKLGQNSGQQLPKTILTIPPPTQQRAPTTSTQSQQPTQAAEQQQGSNYLTDLLGLSAEPLKPATAAKGTDEWTAF